MSNKVILIVISFVLWASCRSGVGNYTNIEEAPSIFPDYTGILIPPNIAPLNFKINEPGIDYEARFFLEHGKPIIVSSTKGIIQIPVGKWHSLLEKGKGKKLLIEIFVKKQEGKWMKYQSIENEIATQSIDNHLAYRLMDTSRVFGNKMGIYQRNLENFDEEVLLDNKNIDNGSVNCHSFSNNNPGKMMIHMMDIHEGTVISNNGELVKINIGTKQIPGIAGYPNWHPNGRHIAYAVNNNSPHQCAGEVKIESSKQGGDIIILDTEKNEVTTSPKVSTANIENLPVWSPDGNYLYYISAATTQNTTDSISGNYNLMRIILNVNTNQWGEAETILDSRALGKSISFPKISPNGKFMIFCTSDNGYFTIHQPKADLHLLKLETGKFLPMEINSGANEGYHSFSSDGHWFVFSSNRLDSLLTRPYFSYLDDNGNASKPFVLPQKDPEFYSTFQRNYNIPELITGEVKVSPRKLRKKIMEEGIPVTFDSSVDTGIKVIK